MDPCASCSCPPSPASIPWGDGVSLGILNKPIGLYSTAIGVGAFVSTYLGLFLARRLSGALGSKVEMLAGAVLIALGIKMLSI